MSSILFLPQNILLEESLLFLSASLFFFLSVVTKQMKEDVILFYFAGKSGFLLQSYHFAICQHRKDFNAFLISQCTPHIINPLIIPSLWTAAHVILCGPVQQQCVTLSNCRNSYSQLKDSACPYVGHEAKTMRQAVIHPLDYCGGCSAITCTEVI